MFVLFVDNISRPFTILYAAGRRLFTLIMSAIHSIVFITPSPFSWHLVYNEKCPPEEISSNFKGKLAPA